MRLISSADGRRRIWYRADEIERVCARALLSAGLWPEGPRSDVDIEALVENHLGALVDYGVDLPAEVLGYTEFGATRKIAVNRALTDAATRDDSTGAAIGRWRATIAHEAAHVLLHAQLFDRSVGTPGRPNERPIRCPRRSLEAPEPRSDWREVQANMGMASLLMPRELFDREATTAFEVRGRYIPPVSANIAWVESVVTVLADRFLVSRQAARIRLAVLGYIDGA